MKSTTLLLSMLFLFSSILAQNSKEYHLLIGTYSNKDKSNGIYVYKFNTESGTFEPAQPVTSSVNASYLAISADRKNVYAVSEGGGGNGGVNSYSFNPTTGALKFINSVPSEGGSALEGIRGLIKRSDVQR